MTDGREVPLETTEGSQQGPSGGERILVGLALIALLGGGLIVAGNLLVKGQTSSVASGSPHPTLRPSPTPSPTPAPVVLSVVPASEPSPIEIPGSQFSGWIRANVDLPILSGTDAHPTTLGTLAAGQVAYGDSQQVPGADRGWLLINAPEPTGWVATLDAGTELAQRIVPDAVPTTGWISELVGGPRGFVAIGQRSGRNDNYPATQVFSSKDGFDWQAAIDPPRPSCCWNAVAWGPAGWLLVGSHDGSRGEVGDTLIWTSRDGLRWSPPGLLADPTGSISAPTSVVGSDLGYLLTTYSRGGFSGSGEGLWFSRDGRSWTQSNAGQLANDFLHIVATPIGFFAWNDPAQSGNGHELAEFSSDGLTWSPVLGGPRAFTAEIAPLGDQVIAMETDPATGELRAWMGSINDHRFSWGPMAGAVAPFTGAVVTALASDGQRAVAFGRDRVTEEALTWTSDGGPWSRQLLPPSFDGIPSVAATGGGGMVVLGHRWNQRGDNPVIWHRTTVGGWSPERFPVLGIALDPTPADCGRAPRDAVEFINQNTAAAAACFGDEPISFRAWSSFCDGCGTEADTTYEPTWLASPAANTLRLLPVSGVGVGEGFGVLAPTLGASPKPTWINAWLELTGHYDDPAAADCRWTPPSDQLQNYPGAESIVSFCRQEFVVTAVTVVDGPAV